MHLTSSGKWNRICHGVSSTSDWILFLQKELGADESLLERDHMTGICRLMYDSAPSGRFGSMTYLSKAVACYVEDFLPSGACAIQWSSKLKYHILNVV